MAKEIIFNAKTGEKKIVDINDTPIEEPVIITPTVEERLTDVEAAILAIMDMGVM